jgi:hypothetical protein
MRTTSRIRQRWILSVLGLLLPASLAQAGGPLLVFDHQPVLWAGRTITGGPLGSTTVSVDASGKRTVFYRVDSGPLGPLSNEYATHLVDRIFGEYTAIPTADIDFANAGRIRDPRNGAEIDIDGSNVGLLFGAPTLQNAIVFDSDGGITGTGGVLGFFTFLAFDGPAAAEGIVVLNGSVMQPPFSLSPASFLGVFTHEFGHFAGPLDHAQINGNIAVGSTSAALPAGLTRAAAYDLFAPFIETLFPFVLFPAPGSTEALDTGYFIASLDEDTRNAMSNLYPTPEYAATSTGITGRVFFRSGDTKVPVDGMNVVARRIDQGGYPPPAGTVAFPQPPAFDADGIPAPPPPQAATDSLASVSSAVTGLDHGFGGYEIRGLAPGDYMVMLQRINPSAIGGSSIGPSTFQPTLPVNEQYFDRDGTSRDVAVFTPVTVGPGNVRPAVDLEVLGLDTSPPLEVGEAASHMTKATAQALGPLPVLVQGSVAEGDPFATLVNFGGGQLAPVPDLYKFTVAATTTVWISLEPIGEGARFSADLDLYLFLSSFNPVVVPIGTVPRYSLTGTAHELIGVRLGAGTYYVGVSPFAGRARYRLRVVPEQPPV